MKKTLSLILATQLLFGLAQAEKVTVRLGYFPNLTHAAALVGLGKGFFQKELGKDVKLEPKDFVSGTSLNEAFAAGAIDIAYIGPGPAINGAAKGLPVQIIAGASNAGAVLIARKDVNIQSFKDLAGKKVAIPSIGNTQDISLRHILKEQGLKPTSAGGNVTLLPVAPADILAAFASKQIDATLVPRPWGALLQEKGNKLVGDHKSIWRNGNYPTTVVIVNTKFATEHPDLVKAFIKAHTTAVNFVNTQKIPAETVIAQQLQALTGSRPSLGTLQKALSRTIITTDLDVEALKEYGALNQESGFTRTLPDFNTLINLSYFKK